MCNAIRVTGIAKQVLHQENRSSADTEKMNAVAGVNSTNEIVLHEKKGEQSTKSIAQIFNPYAKKSIPVELKSQQNTGESSKSIGQSATHSISTITVFNPYAKKAPISNDDTKFRQSHDQHLPQNQRIQHLNPVPSRHMNIVTSRSNPHHPEKNNASVHSCINITEDSTILPKHPSALDRQGTSRESHTKRIGGTKATAAKKQKTLSFTNSFQSKGHEEESNIEANIPLDGYVEGPVPIYKEFQSTWIYPQSETYAERKYQLSISQTAIMYDTLVSLPTGLGKTLIASVVMYNFYRWFPKGKVVFLAPTRPLVTQQIEACFNIMGIPETDTAEMSGRNKRENRERLWKSRRCFFCTPQTFEKDLEEGRCDAAMVTCLVLDEAHKATGSYAYVNVVKQLRNKGAKFRLLGLSATPGKDLMSIKKVVETLHVSKIEARVEDDDEVKPYTHDKQFEIIKIDLSTAAEAAEGLLSKIIMPRLQQLRESNQMGSYRGSDSRITAYNLLTCMQARKQLEDNSMIHHFLVVQSLLRARDALREAGIGLARIRLLQFMKDHGTKGLGSAITKEDAFLQLWRTIVKAPDSGKSFSQDTSEDLKLNNAKLQKLDDILHEHFARAKSNGESSRAIVFSQWRDSVEEIVHVLKKSALVKPSKFVGQGSGSSSTLSSNDETKQKKGRNTGMNQKEQQNVIQQFKSGIFNCLVCTCIGEEGLDIGSVDLIVNFDCLRSPIRMVQRTGRTGRKRKGRVVCLVSKGQEERKLENSEQATKLLWKALRNPKNFTLSRSAPIIPVQPILERRIMNVSKQYRLSQIGGHSHRKKQRDNRDEYASGVWWLSETEEVQRLREFGDLHSFDSNVRRIYVKKWNTSQMIDRSRGTTLTSQILVQLKKFQLTSINTSVRTKTSLHNSSNVSSSDINFHNKIVNSIEIIEPGAVEIIPSYVESDNDYEDNILFSPDSTASPGLNPTCSHDSGMVSAEDECTNDVFGPQKQYTPIGEDVFSIIFGSFTDPSLFPKPLHQHQNTISEVEVAKSQNDSLENTDLMPHSTFQSSALQTNYCVDAPKTSTEEVINLVDKSELSPEINQHLTNKNEHVSEVNDELLDQNRDCSKINEMQVATRRHLKRSANFGVQESLTDSPIQVIKGMSHKLNDTALTDSPIQIRKPSNRDTINHDDLVDTPLCARNSKYNESDSTPGSLADTPLSIVAAPPKDSHSHLKSTQIAQVSKEQKLEKIRNLQRKNMSKGVAKFFDLEADASDSDDDDDDEDVDLSQDSFINDSSQLGYTQTGSLSLATQSNEKKDRNSVSMYRRINNSNTLNDLFSTPLLNRRSKSSDFSCPSSDAQLGKMNFIRSVIEHHQRGGSANELEKQYNNLILETATPIEKGERTTVGAILPSSKPPVKLTAEQMARVEANRKKALLRRQAANKQI